MKAYKSLFKHIYEKYGGRQRKPGEKLNLSLQELEMIVEESGMVADEMCN